MTLHFLNDMVNDAKLTQKLIIASLKSEPLGKQMNRIPGSHLMISSLPGSTFRMHVDSLSKHRDYTSLLKALPGKLNIIRHSPSILYGCSSGS